MNTDTGEIFKLADFRTEEEMRKTHPNCRMIERELTPFEVKNKKIGRNSPCGCGSGKKFKKCCWTGRDDSTPDDSHADEMIQDMLDKY